MTTRLLLILALLTACSSCGQNVSKTFEISAARLAEIQSKPYIGGNGPGGFAAASLSGFEDGSRPEGILFLGFGPYLHEMGFKDRMMITAIDGRGVHEIFANRWKDLRLQDPAAYDAAHYRDLIEYIFVKEPGEYVVISLDANISVSDINAGTYKQEIENWRINFQR